jgi:hypothetical protein
MPLDKAKTEGPEPEMPEPNAPAASQAAFNSLKYGIRIDLAGSTMPSTKDLLNKS